AGESVAGCPVGEVLNRHLTALRNRDGVTVVLTDEDHPQFVNAGEVHRLMAIALARAALTEIGGGHRVFLALFRCQRDAGGMEQLGGDRAPARHDMQPAAAEVPGHLATTAVGVFAPGEEGQHLVFRRHAEPKDDAGVARVGGAPIMARQTRRRLALLGALLAPISHGVDSSNLASAVSEINSVALGPMMKTPSRSPESASLMILTKPSVSPRITDLALPTSGNFPTLTFSPWSLACFSDNPRLATCG